MTVTFSEIRDEFQRIKSLALKGSIEAQLNCYGLSYACSFIFVCFYYHIP